MPLTFLSHQAPVLPLKILAPRWFDGTALVVGSMAPDLAFVTHGTDWYVDAHTLGPLLWLCVPLTVALTWVIKRIIAGPLAAHLPDAGSFHLRDYGRLASWRLPTRPLGWAVLVTSALLGSLSHLAIDSFTHGFGWVVQNVAPLRAPAFALPSPLSGRPVYVHDVLQITLTVIGAAVTVWCAFVIGRRRLLRDWYPVAPPFEATRTSRRCVWGGVVIGTVIGLVTGATTARVGGAQDLIIRIASISFIGLAVGSLAARRTSSPNNTFSG